MSADAELRALIDIIVADTFLATKRGPPEARAEQAAIRKRLAANITEI